MSFMVHLRVLGIDERGVVSRSVLPAKERGTLLATTL
jgi:hypothetical protein